MVYSALPDTPEKSSLNSVVSPAPAARVPFAAPAPFAATRNRIFPAYSPSVPSLPPTARSQNSPGMPVSISNVSPPSPVAVPPLFPSQWNHIPPLPPSSVAVSAAASPCPTVNPPARSNATRGSPPSAHHPASAHAAATPATRVPTRLFIRVTPSVAVIDRPPILPLPPPTRKAFSSFVNLL